MNDFILFYSFFTVLAIALVFVPPLLLIRWYRDRKVNGRDKKARGVAVAGIGFVCLAGAGIYFALHPFDSYYTHDYERTLKVRFPADGAIKHRESRYYVIGCSFETGLRTNAEMRRSFNGQ